MASILGVDPGFANLGWAVLHIGSRPELVDCGVIVTKKSNRKQPTFAASDTFRRARELSGYLENRAGAYLGEVRILASESMSWPRNAATSAKLGMAWGILASLSERFQWSSVDISPQELKRHFLGRASGSKEEIQTAVLERWPEMEGVVSGITPGLREHIYDAAAVSLMAFDTSEVARVLR